MENGLGYGVVIGLGIWQSLDVFGMKVTTVSCQGCGKPIRLEGVLRYVTCATCRSLLEVVQTESEVHTILVDDRSGQTDMSVAKQLEIVRLEKELYRIEFVWNQKRRSMMILNRYGGEREPSSPGAWFTGILSVVMAIVVLMGMIGSGAPGPMLCVPILVVAVVLMRARWEVGRARELETCRAEFEERRRELWARIKDPRVKEAGAEEIVECAGESSPLPYGGNW